MRRGAALVAVVFALVLAGALATGGAFVARRALAAARLAAEGGALLPALERSLVATLSAWDTTARAGQPIGRTDTLSGATEGRVLVEVWVTRTTASQYWMVGRARLAGAVTLERMVGVLVTASGGTPRVVFPRGWVDVPGGG